MVYVTPPPDLKRGLVGRWSLNEQGGNIGANLVANPGFETYTTSPGFPDGWGDTFLGTPGAQCAKETTIFRSGANSVKITGNGVNGAMVNRSVTLVAGHSYYFEGWVRSDGTNAAFAFVRNTTDSTYVIAPTGTTNTTFTKFSGTFTAVAGKSYIVGGGMSAGTPPSGSIVYIDDISLVEIVAADSSGQGNHGVLSGATNTAGPTISQTGQVGTAYLFDGTDDYISIPDAYQFSPANFTGYTFAAWAKKSAAAEAGDIINKATNPYEWNLAATATAYSLTTWKSDGTNHAILTSTAIADTNWHHIVFTITLTAGVVSSMACYIDGQLNTSSTPTPVNTMTDTAANLTIGKRGDDGGNGPFSGLVDEARLYNRALTAQEVSLLYQQGSKGVV